MGSSVLANSPFRPSEELNTKSLYLHTTWMGVLGYLSNEKLDR